MTERTPITSSRKRRRVKRVEFALEGPVDVMIDGEIANAGLRIVGYPSRRHGRLYMTRIWELFRSAFLWFVSWLHFLIFVPILIALAIVLDPRKHDWLQRGLCRRIAYFSGAKIVVNRSPGFDARRTCIFMVNHVNLFDPFMLYCAIPQLVRGWELESHFRIPAYGWLMKRFGNVPVPTVRSPGI